MSGEKPMNAGKPYSHLWQRFSLTVTLAGSAFLRYGWTPWNRKFYCGTSNKPIISNALGATCVLTLLLFREALAR